MGLFTRFRQTVCSLQYTGTVFQMSIFPGGTYSGLVIQTNALSSESSGFLSLALNLPGTFIAQLTMGSVRLTFHGQFDVAGNATNTISRNKLSPLQVMLQLTQIRAPPRDMVTGH